MRYPGGKSASGAFQQVINQIPPHRVYIEAFVGGGTVFERKAPAASSILIDLDAEVARYWSWRCNQSSDLARLAINVIHGDATRWLASNEWHGDEFVYLDPPYHHDTRTKKRIYRHEMDDGGHRDLLRVLQELPVPFALSGYRNPLYDDVASNCGWRRVDFQCMTRRGPRTESLWMNYEAPARLAEYDYVGSTFRERERIRRKVSRWMSRLETLPELERNALLSAMTDRFGGHP